MESNRRDFLRAAGIKALGIGGGSLVITAARGMAELGEDPDGKRWAMHIDTVKCASKEGCRECMDACHLIHNVPDVGTVKEEIKWIWKEEFHYVFPERTLAHDEIRSVAYEKLAKRQVVVLCNHCDNPPCVRVCPTQATFRRDDGIIMMDQHRCIGCRYCIVACPYSARNFNFRDPRPYLEGRITAQYPTRTKGVVEKCTFCAARLAEGKQPKCVEACNDKGAGCMTFGDLNDKTSEIYELVQSQLLARRRSELGTRPSVYYTV